MRSRTLASNWYLWCSILLAAAFCTGCQSPEERRKNKALYTELWLHSVIPQPARDTNQLMAIEVAGVRLAVQRRPFLTEEYLKEADVVDSPGGGYSLRLEFDDHGKLLLESYTTANRSRHFAVFVRYGIRKDKDETPLTERWLAAPLISRPVPDGVLVFTPNVTKVELYRIVDGLKKAAELNAKPWVF